jgi:hypothetical protein
MRGISDKVAARILLGLAAIEEEDLLPELDAPEDELVGFVLFELLLHPSKRSALDIAKSCWMFIGWTPWKRMRFL